MRCSLDSLLLEDLDAHIVGDDQLQHARCTDEWIQRAIETIYSEVEHLPTSQGGQSELLETGKSEDSPSVLKVIKHHQGFVQSAAIDLPPPAAGVVQGMRRCEQR